MTSAVSFQTRARTIDHLGRGQIADSPTAISELWKNAFDAYAKSVTLHVFDGTPAIAAVFDDGVGMDRGDIVERWLVIGTEAKLENEGRPPADTIGLPFREPQGEKGIGRLSIAFLAPATILISKKKGSGYVAVLVDWRLFENPFITLDDIRLPVEEFVEPADAVQRLSSMVDMLRSNLGRNLGTTQTEARAERLSRGWERYSEYERTRLSATKATAETIRETWAEFPLTHRHLEEWPVFVGLEDHGTALFMIGIHHELAVWIRPEDPGDDEINLVKERLRETLTAFTDPYSKPRLPFEYEFLVHRESRNQRIIASDDVFGLENLHELEHFVDGEFDEFGVFRGRVVAFGQDLGVKEHVPRRAPPRTGRDRLGPFSFCIGTFEQDARRSTHSEQQLELLSQQTDKFGGLLVFRDGLRVMPYGRPDADFLGMEERRSRHTGRYFWAHRRSFGRIAFTHRNNTNLRDKAGREGLVENRASRELRILVGALLIELARRYFGTDSELRQELMPGILARNAAAREAAERARSRRRRSVRSFLREQRQPLNVALNEAGDLTRVGEQAREKRDKEAATIVAARYKALLHSKDELRPPPVPAKLGDAEERYREYRDDYREFVARLDALGKLTAEVEADIGTLSPEETIRRSFNSHQSTLSAHVEAYLRNIDRKLHALRTMWRDRGAEDRGTYYKICTPILEDEAATSGLVPVLNLLDSYRRDLEETFAGRYEPFLRALDQLVEGIDLDSALSVIDDDKSDLEERVRDLNAVAQVGITVEIVGHELESLDAEVRRNLLRLPETVRKSAAFKLAFEAHGALTERLRFLSPLKIAGYRSRQRITGAQIANYVQDFFGRTLQGNRIEFTVTPAFRSLAIIDLPSRIFPV
jgi:hypothetical protein